MARNYVDIPILIVKVKAADTCTVGCLLKAIDTNGWKNATAVDCVCGVYALESFDTGTTQYGSAMIVGTFFASHATTNNAGTGFTWSATAGVIDSVADSAAYSVGTVIDPVTAATTRSTRVLIYGTPIQKTVWFS